MDPLTLGAVSIAVVGVVLFIFIKYLNSDESSFDKVYKENQLPLLKDEKEKKEKPKTKPVKAKKEKKANEKPEQSAVVAAEAEKEKEAPVKEEKAAAAAAEPTVEKENIEPAQQHSNKKNEKKQQQAEKNQPEPEKTEKPAKEEKKAKKEETKKEEPKKEEKKQKEKVVEEEVKKETSTPTTAAPPVENGDTTESKKKKKHSEKKKEATAAAASQEEEQPFVAEEFVEAKNRKAKKAAAGGKDEKKQTPPPAPVPTQPTFLSVADLDFDKVLTRFSGVDEVEPEYVAFLASYCHDTNEKATKLQAELAALRSAVAESTKKAEQAAIARAAVEKSLQQQLRVVDELAAKSAAAQSSEQQKAKQLQTVNADMERMHRELDQLRKSLAERAAAPVATTEMVAAQQENEKLRVENRASMQRVTQLEQELRVAQAANEANAKSFSEREQLLKKSSDDELSGRDMLLTEAKQNIQVINNRLTEIEKQNEDLVKKNRAAEQEVNAAQKQLKERESMHVKDTMELKAMIDELTKEVAKFEMMKAEQEELRGKLSSKEKELEEKSRRLVDIEQQLHAAASNGDKEKVILQQLDEAHAELKAVEAKRAAEIAELQQKISALETSNAQLKKASQDVEIPLNNPPIVEEVVELRKSNMLDAVPASGAADPAEMTRLQQEVARLQEKNSELRKRNHTILDQVTQLEQVAAGKASSNGVAEEKQKKTKETAPPTATANASNTSTLEERRLVCASIGALLPNAPQLDVAKADLPAYEKWLKNVSGQLKKAQEKAAAAAAVPKAAKPSSTNTVENEEEVERLREENDTFRDALSTLTEELQNISQLSAEREAQYEKKIATLESKQISSLRAAIDQLPAPSATGLAPSANVSSPPISTSTRSEDDESWEVVSS